MTAKELLINILSTYNENVYLQGTIEPEETLPDAFITFRQIDSDTQLSFDNEDALTTYTFNVNFYSTDPEQVNTTPQLIRKELKKYGFIPHGKGYDLMTQNVNYTAWALEFDYIERQE